MAKAADYIEDVKRYDAGADEAHVQKIVNYCGIALQTETPPLSPVPTETEKNRVRDGFAKKKLGLEAGPASQAIDAVCDMMKGDNQKSRVTFLYLLAKSAGKLGGL